VSSQRASEQLASRDEAALYAATAVAMGAALLAAGGGSGSARVGLICAALGCAGVFSSWHTRHWGLARRLTLGLAAGGAAAGALQGLIGWETEVGGSGIYRALGDVGMTMALRMAVLATAFSFMLVVREMLPFSLVPALAMFGLVGGRGAGQLSSPASSCSCRPRWRLSARRCCCPGCLLRAGPGILTGRSGDGAGGIG